MSTIRELDKDKRNENSTYACLVKKDEGTSSWVIKVDTTSSFPKSFKFVTEDGNYFKLETKELDAAQGKKQFFVSKCLNESEAIEIGFTDKSALKVISGHHTLGYFLDNWYDKKDEGNRQSFTNWPEHSFWQFNDDMTLSPKGTNDLVLGWENHLKLVNKDSKFKLKISLKKSDEKAQCSFDPNGR